MNLKLTLVQSPSCTIHFLGPQTIAFSTTSECNGESHWISSQELVLYKKTDESFSISKREANLVLFSSPVQCKYPHKHSEAPLESP